MAVRARTAGGPATAGLPLRHLSRRSRTGSVLDFHSLRRSYVTHLIEDGWDALFVQQQAGHDHASTTSIYTCVSSDFRTRTLRRALDSTVEAALKPVRRA
ncbi:tyrosine-type recombinase/integrase [Streptomyces sp. NPDC057445]|uniref:tyrosine-type recombinase/integrase n=1 Tax=Streptomyces sp. NPDC057445 TaxID=3346136 RepID=UPI0036C63150